MRKRLIAAGLGLRLTSIWAAGIILLTSAVQVWLFLRTEYLWSDMADNWNIQSFEWVLDEEGIALVGKLSFVLLLGAVVLPCASVRNRNAYTLRRLRIGENQVTAIWALIFSGYFLISWAVQLGVVLWMASCYARVAGMGVMDLFVAAYRSTYFHTLLPLAEIWGYVRNGVICLSWGAMGSLIARYVRHGGKSFLAVGMVVLTGWLLPTDMATAGNDIMLSVLLLAMVGLQIYLMVGGGANED